MPQDQQPGGGDQAQAGGGPLDQAAFDTLRVDWSMRDAFARDEPLAREEYMNRFFLPSYGAAAYRITPSYEEYLKLFELYTQARKSRGTWSGPMSDFYLGNMM
jgi:hypothetical protein